MSERASRTEVILPSNLPTEVYNVESPGRHLISFLSLFVLGF